MIPPRFDYRRADGVEEALDLIAGADAELLAGGHSLIPALKNDGADPDLVVDVGGIDAMEGIEVREGDLRIGALTTHADLLESDPLARAAPVLVEAASKLGDRQVRNRGTIGGNLACGDPGVDLPPAAVAAGATIEIRGPDGSREVLAGEFFPDDRETAVGPDELVTAVRVPRSGGTGVYRRKTHPATGYALVGVAAALDRTGEDVTGARIAATGALDRPVRLDAVEEEIVGTPGTEDDRRRAAEAATRGFDESAFRSDPHASGAFRAHLLSVYVEEALSAALASSD